MEPLELLSVVSMGEKRLLKPVNPQEFVVEIDDFYSDIIDDDEVRQEWEQDISPLLNKYCREHGLL